MFDINNVPVFIANKRRHGRRYNIDIVTKDQIYTDFFKGKRTKKYISEKYRIPIPTLNKILKEKTQCYKN